ncbi:MAG: CHRD domain-containing protein [Chloroflexi bacterium]|nr:CHRD domain-containing protein [Chloroflexota bacterium]
MKKFRLSIIVTVLVLLMVSPAVASGRPFSTTLTGAAEAPGPGDPDGTGAAVITVNPGLEEVCFKLKVSDIAPATAAHIHVGAVGEPGPVVVPLVPPTSGESSGCIGVDQALALDIIRHPDNYYVNVHNAEYPAGALRGQLSR